MVILGNSGIPLINNIRIVYKQPKLDFSLKPDRPSTWELYLEKRDNQQSKSISSYHQYYLILSRIRNIVKSGQGITDEKVKYLFKDKWDD